MSRDLVFSSKKYNGLGIKHPYYLQHIKHIAVLWGARSLDPQSKVLVNAVWEEACFECGWGNDLMEAPMEILELITDGWLKETVFFMKKHNTSIVRIAPDIQMQRNNDTFIMKYFHDVCNNKATLQGLNLCRMYLKVLKVSDITSAQGTTVLLSNNHQVILNRHTERPRLRKVPEFEQLDWKSWDFYLHRSGIAYINNKLQVVLGP